MIINVRLQFKRKDWETIDAAAKAAGRPFEAYCQQQLVKLAVAAAKKSAANKPARAK